MKASKNHRICAALLSVLLAGGAAQGLAAEVADAVMRGDSAALDALIASGADVNVAQPDGATALHWAAYRDDVGAVRRLLEAGADANVANRAGTTPLLMASIAGNVEMIRLLLAAGADPHETFTNGETVLMMAARTGRPEAIEVLLKHGVEIDARERLRGTTALMWAAAYSNPDAVRVLLEAGADYAATSATIARGRAPYLAPSARERIDEYLSGTGLRGAALRFELDENGDGESAASDAPATGTDESRAATDAASSDPAASDEEAIVANADDTAEADAVEEEDEGIVFNRPRPNDWGGLTPLIFAARQGDLESVKLLIEAGADVNQQSEFGWTALLTATQNRYYELGAYLLEQGADPNLANRSGWNALYLATDNRNIEGGDYPTRKPDMDHFAFIELLLERGADPNQRLAMGCGRPGCASTETRTIFTHQWLYEEGATPFLRASQSGDLKLMRLLLEHGADPAITTEHGVTPLMVAAGIGWVEGVTFEWSEEDTLEAVELLLELGADPNARETLDGRTALMGAAHKGRSDVVQLLVDHGADLAARDIGSRDSIHSLAGVTWQAIDYADGLVRVGVQSAIPHAETAALLRRLMEERGLEAPPEGRTLDSICITDLCR